MLFNSNDDKKNNEIFLSVLKSWEQKSSENAQIYVVVQNPYQKQTLNELLENNKIFSKNVIVTTFLGLVYNSISENKDKLPGKITNINLSGLDASQYILKDIIKEVNFKDYKSQINVLHQLFRRYSLIVQNDLSKEEVKKRSQIAGEAYIEECEKAIDLYRKISNKYGVFDYLRQLSIFKYLMENSQMFENIKYLCVFHAEEYSHIFYDFLKYVSKNLSDFLIFYNNNSATRIGYLCAPTECEDKLVKLFKTEPKKVEKQCKYSKIIQKIQSEENSELFENNEFLYRTEMINDVKSSVEKLINRGVKPNEIAIITPIVDETSDFILGNDKFYFLSGNIKLIDDFAIKNVIFFNDLLEEKIDFEKQNFEVRKFLSTFFDFEEKENEKVSNFIKNNEKFEEIAKKISKISILSQRIVFLYKKLAQNFNFSSKNNKNIKFLEKQIADFEKIFPKSAEDKEFQREIVEQLKISVVSENSSEVEKIPQGKVIVATEQKFIDFAIERKHVFLMDFTSAKWSKNDIGPMYNSWVMQKEYAKNSFDVSDNIKFSSLKTKRILSKILLNTTEQLYIYSSLYDACGQENYSDLSKYLKNRSVVKNTQRKIFKLRPEQEKIREYKSGYMAISAVPGAGKTTVILEVVKKLLEIGEKSENIFVLTYMESAAKNFKERLKEILPKNSKLPNISTIHGLALRIIKENSNFAKLNLDEDFEIADDTKRSILFSRAFFANKVKEEYFSDFERGISVMKFVKNPKIANIKDVTLKKFVNVYNTYCSYLKENNLIDYDDMLILATQLLEENPDILTYYQNMCKFIIEDEAQDSSAFQQKLLLLLSGKHKNFIRCGDANQAITETFTNADTQGFRQFIKNNISKQMTTSQRSISEIAEFANKLNSSYPNAFLQIKIKAAKTDEKNQNALQYNVFEEEKEEILNIANSIKAIYSKDKNAQVAILVRNNYQVEKYEKILHENGIKTVIKEGNLGQQKVFAVIFAVLKILKNPHSPANINENYQTLCNYGCYKINEDSYENNQFYWDLKYFQKLNFNNYANLVTKIGYFYFKDEVDKSNVEILSFITKRICNEKSTFEELLQEFEKLSKKPLAAFFKFFETTSESQNSALKVQIMTIHKSKGNEFDYVFIPEFSNENFPCFAENCKVKAEDLFLENIKSLGQNYLSKSRRVLQELAANETLRLIYVAITRAKKALYISYSKEITKFGKKKTATEVSDIISLI